MRRNCLKMKISISHFYHDFFTFFKELDLLYSSLFFSSILISELLHLILWTLYFSCPFLYLTFSSLLHVFSQCQSLHIALPNVFFLHCLLEVFIYFQIIFHHHHIFSIIFLLFSLFWLLNGQHPM